MGWFSKEPEFEYYDDDYVDDLIEDLKHLKIHEGHTHILGVRAIAEEYGIIIKENETCIAYVAALYLQWKKPKRSNLRIFNYGRIVGDIRYRYEKQPEEELISTGAGVFLVTTQRLIFFPPEEGDSFSIKLSNLLSFQILDSGAIELRKSNSKKPIVIQFADSKDADEMNFNALQTAKLFYEYITQAIFMNNPKEGVLEYENEILNDDDILIEEIDDIDVNIEEEEE